jgi:type I restriction enzyme S subunit
MCLTKEPTLTNQQINSLIVDHSRVVPRWAFYTLKAMREEITAIASGSATPIINKTSFGNIRLSVPPLATQRRIASILGAYDDLIEVNRRRIAVLEEMARGLFEEWFVRFRFPGHEAVPILDTPDGPLPQGWRRSTVKDLVQRVPVKTRYSQKTAYPEGLVPILDQGKSGIIGYHNEEPSVRADLDHPVIVFANHTCYQKVVHFSFSAIQNVLPFVPSKAAPQCVYWLHHATTGLVELNDYKGHWPEFLSKAVPVPPTELAEEFDRFAKPLHTASYNFQLQQEGLGTSRDLLLPRLISGQLSVAEATRELEEAA